MENKFKNKYLIIILITILIGIWGVFLQNLGIIPTVNNVIVLNPIKIKGSVYVAGEVDANINKTVDINISEINGNSNSFYDHGYNGVYDRIPVYTGD
jgi:hypothetical protein